MSNSTLPRTTAAREVTEADVVLHAAHSGDFYPHHLDVEFCRAQAFGQRIAHGTLTFLIAIALQEEAWPDLHSPSSFDRLRFVRPVHIGDQIHVRVSSLRSRDTSPDARLLRPSERCEVVNQDNQTVLVFEQHFEADPGATA